MFEMRNRFNLSTPIGMVNHRSKMVQAKLVMHQPVEKVLDMFNVSRPILYKFIGRFKTYGKLGLYNISKAPLNHGRQTPHEKVKLLFDIHKEHPYFSDYELNEITNIAKSTIQRIRVKNKLIKVYKPKKLKKKILEELKKNLQKRKRR